MAFQTNRIQIDGSLNVDGSIYQFNELFTPGTTGGGGGGDVQWASGDITPNDGVVTATGDGSIHAEDNLLFNGSTLTIDGSLMIHSAGDPFFIFDAQGPDFNIGDINGVGDAGVLYINGLTSIIDWSSNGGASWGSNTERFYISGLDVSINGNLLIDACIVFTEGALSNSKIYDDGNTLYLMRSGGDIFLDAQGNVRIMSGFIVGSGGSANSTFNGDVSITGALYVDQTDIPTGSAAANEFLFIDADDRVKRDSAVTSVAAGNGMNFTTIATTGTVTMGTPGTLTNVTANGVTSTSHTHEIINFAKLAGNSAADRIAYYSDGSTLTNSSTLTYSSGNLSAGTMSTAALTISGLSSPDTRMATISSTGGVGKSTNVYDESTKLFINKDLSVNGSIVSNGALYLDQTDIPTGSAAANEFLFIDADDQVKRDSAVTSVATTAPLQGTITTTGTLSITQATTSTDGYLSSTDWNTFNNKTDGSLYVTNNIDNRILTATSGNALNAETALLFSAATLTVGTTGSPGTIQGAGGSTDGFMLTIKGGDGGSAKGGALNLIGGDPGGTGTYGVFIDGGASSSAPGDVSIHGGKSTSTVAPGNVYIYGGVNGGIPGNTQSGNVYIGTKDTSIVQIGGVASSKIIMGGNGINIDVEGSDITDINSITFQAESQYVIRFNADTNTGFYWNNTTRDLYLYDDGTSRFKFDIDTGQFDADGDVIAYSTLVGSDERLKTNIEPLLSSLDIIKRLNAVSYERIEKPGEIHLGFIAQQIEPYLPEVVKEKNLLHHENEGLYKTINYTEIIPVLSEAIKEQQEIIDKQEKRIENLENKLNDILKKLD